MNDGVNTQVRLAERPLGVPDEKTWKIEDGSIPAPADGEVLVAVEQISIDPAMRAWLRDRRSYVEPIAIGELMRAQAVARVVESRHPDHAEGELVAGKFGVQQYAVAGADEITRVDSELAPAATWLGLLGYPGLTAYFGLFDVAKAQPGDVVLVSAAAGAVGSVFGQLAKLHGCRVIGIAGGPDKCAWLREISFDAAIDYKNEDVGKALRSAAPEGIDVYFDNVGGEILDLALTQLRLHARVVICGGMSGYNATEPPPGPQNYMSLLVNRASMIGMLVFDYEDRYGEAIEKLAGWLREGKLTAREQVVDGSVADFPEVLLMLFSGANTGKLVLEVA
jgi:NADPH-dependent curcumin reductase CurA